MRPPGYTVQVHFRGERTQSWSWSRKACCW